MNDLQPNNILIYRADDDRVRLEVKLDKQTIWLSQKQLGELYQKSKATISEHIKNIFQDGELDPKATVRKFRTVQKEGGCHRNSWRNCLNALQTIFLSI